MATEAVSVVLTDDQGATHFVGTRSDTAAWFETRDMECLYATRGEAALADKFDKFLEAVLVEMETLGLMASVTIELGFKDRLTDTVEWQAPFSVSTGNAPVFGRWRSFRYVRLRVTDSSVSGRWKLSAIELLGRLDGGRM